MGLYTSIAEKLVERCKLLDEHLESKSLNPSSSDETLFDEYLLEGLPPSLDKIRSSVVDEAQKLADLVTEPKDHITRIQFSFNDVLALQAIANFKLGTHVPSQGSITFSELEKASGLKADYIKRFIQISSLKYVFRQTSADSCAHTASSRLLTGPDCQGLYDEVGYITNDLSPGAVFTLQALEKYPDDNNGATTEQNKTGFSVANNTSDSTYVEMSKNPERIRRFGSAMRSMTSGTGYSVQHFVEGYDWAALAKRGATIVDVGGGQGGVSRAVEAAHPGIKCVIQDMPASVTAGRAALPEDKKGSIEFEVHDFFTPQKRTADLYFLRWILHNWSDKYATQIIRNLVPAMKPGARVVIYEYILPDVTTPGSRYDWYRRVVDILMLSSFAGKERSAQQFIDLFQQADPRFRHVATIDKLESAMSILVMELGDAPHANGAVNEKTPGAALGAVDSTTVVHPQS